MEPEPANRTDSSWQSTWQQHTPWLRTVLTARLGDALTVEEVLQDVAVTAWQKRAQLVDSEKLGPWLYRIAIRKVQMVWRLRHKTRTRSAEELTSEPDDRQVDPIHWIISEEAHDLVRQAMRQLSPQDREILMLKHTENWTYNELSLRLGISIDKIVYRLSRARKRLREKLVNMQLDWSQP